MATGDRRQLLRRFLATLAYRTQKALRDAPSDFGAFEAAQGVRTPAEARSVCCRAPLPMP